MIRGILDLYVTLAIHSATQNNAYPFLIKGIGHFYLFTYLFIKGLS